MSTPRESRPTPVADVRLLTLPGTDVPLVESLNDAIVVAGADNRVLYANAATRRLLGWGPADLVGRHVTVLVPERLKGTHAAGFSRFVATRQPHILGQPTRVPALHADGHEVPVELLLSTIAHGADGLLVVATLRDVHDRLDLERQTALAHHLLGVMAEEGAGGRLVERMLAALGANLEWEVAALWLPVPGTRLVCAGLWQDPAAGTDPLAAASRELRLRPGAGLPGRVWQTGEPAWITDIELDHDFPRRTAAAASGLRSAFAFPVQAGGATVGVIELFRRRPSEPDSVLLRTMGVIGARLGEFLHRADVENERRRLAEGERAVAASLQRSLLPPRLPVIPGIELGARFRPGGEVIVGGDFYDVFPVRGVTGGPMWALAIGDVCGTGPEAAAITAQVRHTARALAHTGHSPNGVLSEVNEALLERFDDSRFCTVVFATVVPTPAGVRLCVANAGHPVPLLSGADGAIRELPVTGTLLGVVDDFALEEGVFDLVEGDVLVLYTDGITEARRGDEVFGTERLEAVLASARGLTAPALAAVIEEAAVTFASGFETDDMAILVVRVTSR